MSLRTSLYSAHCDLKAKIVDFAGWDMPVQYTSVKDEVLAVRQSAGVFDVSHMGEFFAEGPEAIAFVDYVVTNQIAEAPMGKAIYSPLCREDGTIVDDLIVYKLSQERVMICVNASNIEKDFNWIKTFAPKFKVTLTNASESFSLLALQGPQSIQKLKNFIPDLPEMDYYSVWSTQLKGGEVIVARTGYTGEDGFEIFANHETIAQLWQNLLKNGVIPCGLAARDVLRLEVCYPLYGHEIDDTVTPLDAGLGWTVKKEKMQFVGKKTLEGYKPKYKLVKIILEKGIPREGYPVLLETGEKVGHVTSGTMSVILNKGVALARVRADIAPGTNFLVSIRDKNYHSTIVTKPFIQGGHK